MNCEIGNRIRIKIKKASDQLKIGTNNGELPSMLVLYADGMLNTYLEDYDIKAAMYGFEQYSICVPNNPAIPSYVTGSHFGSNRTMREKEKEYISAIAVMKYKNDDSISLSVYHNCFAKKPIMPSDLPADVKHYRLKNSSENKTPDWEIFHS